MGFVTGAGQAISLGREIGRGGEGAVFEVVGHTEVVAKLYHELPDKQKQNKLRYMASHSSDSLYSFTSWPQGTVHKARGGPVVGFLMRNVGDCVPVHNLYSPAHRRQVFPRVGWDFLVFAARNTAAAFDALHHHGHVLGDVNQGNVMVRKDARVLLIDSDSFQIHAGPDVYICEVGVSHFTPPELQGINGFSGVRRTVQHDVFGLALIVFHLLFGGRHPYSGVPLSQAAGNALEEDIKALRFAYARDAHSRGIAPPPRSIPVSLVPMNIEGMFRYAFTEPGIKGQRPSAAQWVAALDGILCELNRCDQSTLHAYPKHCPTCPWCELDKAGVVYFIDLVPPSVVGAVFDLSQVWARIEAVPAPQSPTVAVTHTARVSARPLPPEANRKGEILIYRGLVVAAAIGLSLATPGLFLIFLFAAWVGCAVLGTLGDTERRAERAKREAVLREATRAMAAVEANARIASGSEAFAARKQHLLNLRNEYAGLAMLEQKEIASLQTTARARQLHAFLDQHFLDDAVITGVGPAKKAALLSFGIETAADVDWGRVHAVKGFGKVLTSAVVQWRKDCEQKFRFDPQRAVSQADVDGVRAKIAHRRKQLEADLLKGATELHGIQQQGHTRATVISAHLSTAALQLAQAKADMAAFN
jgi:DNA-binding helix-hairpin-helix protein with protein kinase domain